jgi:hypothetical protein
MRIKWHCNINKVEKSTMYTYISKANIVNHTSETASPLVLTSMGCMRTGGLGGESSTGCMTSYAYDVSAINTYTE